MQAKTNTKAYPLAWPKDRPRTKTRQRSRFGDRSVAESYKLLQAELSRLAARGVVVSTNIPLKSNGEPYSDKTKLPDPGVAVYFRMLGDKPYCLSCDRWDLVEDNLHAVSKHIEAMRGMERWGAGSVEQAFAGFKMIAASSEPDWWETLGLDRSTVTEERIQVAYRARVPAAHPDRNGDDGSAMTRLNLARDRGLAELRTATA